MDIPDHLANTHDLPKGRKLEGHKIVVEGFYFSSVINPHGGGFEKKRVKYREEFVLGAAEHKVAAQGALGHLLSDKILAERLSLKDPDFRAVQSHTVVSHENILAESEPEISF